VQLTWMSGEMLCGCHPTEVVAHNPAAPASTTMHRAGAALRWAPVFLGHPDTVAADAVAFVHTSQTSLRLFDCRSWHCCCSWFSRRTLALLSSSSPPP
jgi:hypothetical protein